MFDRSRLRKVGWLALGALLALAWPVAAVAAPAASQKAPPGFTLNYTKSLRVISGAFLFKKEPAYQGNVVHRGTAKIGAGPNQRPLGFAWDVAANKLYVDANGNLDLTDDPPAENPETNYGQTKFKNIALEVPMGSLKVPTLVNFSFYTYSNIDMPQVEVLTGWSGEWTVDGVKHTVEVVDRDLNGQFSGPDGFVFDRPFGSGSLPGTLVLGGLPYDLSFKPVAAQPAPALECVVTPHPGKTGLLNLTGKSIDQILLRGAAAVQLVPPGPSVRLPVGKYTVAAMDLKSTGTQAPQEAIHWTEGFSGNIPAGDGAFIISENEPATLKMGGPLAATIEAEADGDVVKLSYKMTGNGGEQYPPSLQGIPPGFEVYQGDRKIGAGKFEFG